MQPADTQSTARALGYILRRYTAVALAYVLATALTDAAFMGDTPGYTRAILTYEHGGAYIWDNPFWEFGHLLWLDLSPEGYRESGRTWLFAATESWTPSNSASCRNMWAPFFYLKRIVPP